MRKTCPRRAPFRLKSPADSATTVLWTCDSTAQAAPLRNQASVPFWMASHSGPAADRSRHSAEVVLVLGAAMAAVVSAASLCVDGDVLVQAQPLRQRLLRLPGYVLARQPVQWMLGEARGRRGVRQSRPPWFF